MKTLTKIMALASLAARADSVRIAGGPCGKAEGLVNASFSIDASVYAATG